MLESWSKAEKTQSRA